MPGFQCFQQPDAIFLRLPEEQRGNGRKPGNIVAFAAEAEGSHGSQLIQKRNGSCGKVFGTSYGVEKRQFQHKVRAVVQAGFGAYIFIRHCRRSSLHEIAADNCNHIIRVRYAAGFFQMIFMSVMKRIIFGNNSCNSHRIPQTAWQPAFRIKCSSDVC